MKIPNPFKEKNVVAPMPAAFLIHRYLLFCRASYHSFSYSFMPCSRTSNKSLFSADLPIRCSFSGTPMTCQKQHSPSESLYACLCSSSDNSHSQNGLFLRMRASTEGCSFEPKTFWSSLRGCKIFLPCLHYYELFNLGYVG